MKVSFHTANRFMDYLHGDVARREGEMACYYEYARESATLRNLAKQRDRLLSSRLLKSRKLNPEQVVERLHERGVEHWPCGYLAFEFLVCRSFPVKAWNELSQLEREALLRFERPHLVPLPTTDVWTLKARGVFDAFKALGDLAKPVAKTVKPGQKSEPLKTVPPLLHAHGSVYHVLFDVDFSKGRRQLQEEFSAWLDLPDYRELLRKCKSSKIGTTGKALDRLKDLAVWRLFRELRNDWNAANDFADKHRKKGRPFHDARAGQTEKRPRTEAPLGSEESYFLKAKKRALKYLADYMPEEYADASSPALDEFGRRFLQDAKKAVYRAAKISK